MSDQQASISSSRTVSGSPGRERGFVIRGHLFSAPSAEPGLYLVSTPIGNLGDISIRALETLAGSTVIACEDTRTSGVLLKRYAIDRPKVSYTEHNAEKRGPDLLRQIEEGAAVALISDAGTPLVSDPGSRLVQEAVARGIRVVPIPGASAPLAALVASGLDNTDFRFCGFLPNKAQAKARMLTQLAGESTTLMFFESPARLKASLQSLAQAFGSHRQAVVARELTKLHETFHRGTLEQLSSEFADIDKVRGEIVILIEPVPLIKTSETDVDQLLLEALKTLKTKQAAAHVARQTGASKQELYNRALQLKNDG